MFNKTRRKIIFTVVISLFLLFAVTLTTIYLSNRFTIQRDKEEMLKTYVDRYDDNEKPKEHMPDDNFVFVPDGGKPGFPSDKDQMRNEPHFRLSTFYSVLYSKSGDVISVDNGNTDLHTEESIINIASSALKSGKQKGSDGNIYYMVVDRNDGILVAMIDSTIEDDNQLTLFRQMLIIGSISMVVLFIISIFISKKIVHPLEENDKRQKRFVSDAGHELKTPIAVISANSELLKREIGDNEWLSNIDYENEKMSGIVKQLLALSKAENADIQKETIDLSKLVYGEVLPFETLAFEKCKKIETDIENGLSVDGNANQLRQLVSILLDNAISHGTGDIISLSLNKDRHSAVLVVSNESEEIKQEQVEHLFDRFYRTDESRTDSDVHYGLGLSIAQAVAESHKGKIKAEYDNGKVIFTFSISIKK